MGGGLLQPDTPPWSHMWLRSEAKWRRYSGAGTTLNILHINTEDRRCFDTDAHHESCRTPAR